MKLIRVFPLLLLVLGSFSGASAQGEFCCLPSGSYAAGELFVSFHAATSQARVEEIAAEVGATIIRLYGQNSSFKLYLLGVPVCQEKALRPVLNAYTEVRSASVVDATGCPDIDPRPPTCSCCPPGVICTFTPPCKNDSRGLGFWKHQCSSSGTQQIDPATLDDLLDSVYASSSAFSECAPGDCSTLQAEPPLNDMRIKATRALLAVELNVSSGKLMECSAVSLSGLSNASTVAAAIAEIETAVCDPLASHGDLDTAKSIAEAMTPDQDMELTSNVAILVGGAGRVVFFELSLMNLGISARSYQLSASGPWPVTLFPTTVTMEAGDSIQVAGTVDIPSGLEFGSTGEFRVQAVDTTDATQLSRDLTLVGYVAGGGRLTVRPQHKQLGF